MEKTNIGLVEYAKAQIGKPYWYGTFGQEGTQSLLDYKKKQYSEHYTSSRMSQYQKHIKQKVKVHDCIGLVKGYLWCDDVNDMIPKYVSAQDKSADGMYKICKERGAISTIPELVGVLVFFSGHVGVYIGNGYVIEARGFNYGVVKTRLKDRPWKSWGKCPYIKYITEPKNTTANKTETTSKGDNKVNVKLDVLQKGSKGEQVKALQRMLYAMGYELGNNPIDGDFGTKTDDAVRSYQKKNGLTVDGIVGQNTWSKLLGA